jgi:hypothetical protein
MNLVQVDSMRRPLGWRAVRKPLGVSAPLAERLTAAVRLANGGRVFLIDIANSDHPRAALAKWARTVDGWEVGHGHREGQRAGRPLLWARVKGGPAKGNP